MIERRQTASEPDALRRIATLAAGGAPSSEIFAAAAQEIARVIGVWLVRIIRYGADETAVECARFSPEGAEVPFGSRSPLDGTSVLRLVRDTAKAARIDDYGPLEGEIAESARSSWIRSAVGGPIVIEGRPWGAVVVSSPEQLPPDTEQRLVDFTDLLSAVIANVESRESLSRLAREQAALRRVATLVARGAPSEEVFSAVTEELGQLVPAGHAAMSRYDADHIFTTVAVWSEEGARFEVGEREAPGGHNVMTIVLQTGQPARIDDYSDASGDIGAAARDAGYRAAVGIPIIVDGRLWGVMTAASTRQEPLPADTEARLASFTELVATAIANAQSSAELAASRRRIVAASDEARRRIERDLHDGVQQQLVALALKVDTMAAELPAGDALQGQLASLSGDIDSVLNGLVEIARGVHPAILSQGGLEPALGSLARRSAVSVELEVRIDRPVPDEVAVAAYYIVSEALTNVTKYARASMVQVDVATDDGALTLVVRDDGIGGADPGKGSGLVGLQDRVEALGGTITIDSSPGNGTRVVTRLPIPTEAGR